MSNKDLIKGFSRLSREEKIEIIASGLSDHDGFIREIRQLQHPDPEIQDNLNNFSENSISNFPLPYGIAPNFLINGHHYLVPMVIEESSVVAAASSASRFWFQRGGFHAEVKNMLKIGQVHFLWKDDPDRLKSSFAELRDRILQGTKHITGKMEERGGGITQIELVDLTGKIKNAYQLRFSFNTAESMGANFINSVLEESAIIMKNFFQQEGDPGSPIEILMAILSNYTPECIVKVETRGNIKDLEVKGSSLSGKDFARRFVQAVEIAKNDVYRAVTHNKGIFNGIDAVIIATGNDYRAIEAAGHAYASRNGQYSSLSYSELSEGEFVHGLEIPMALGTVGGLTRLHPLAKWSFEILEDPDAPTLMMIAASAGLANNFSAIRSLVTVGIQKGHMKMHLDNILAFLGATVDESEKAHKEFTNKTISHSGVENFLKQIRSKK